MKYPEPTVDIEHIRREYHAAKKGVSTVSTPGTPDRIFMTVTRARRLTGYSISHAFGTVFGRPDLATLVMVGDTGHAQHHHSSESGNPVSLSEPQGFERPH